MCNVYAVYITTGVLYMPCTAHINRNYNCYSRDLFINALW